MFTISKLNKEHEKLIKNLDQQQLKVYIDNIIKKRVETLPYFYSNNIDDGNLESYVKYKNILENISDVITENDVPDYKQIRKGLFEGASGIQHYNSLLEVYFKQLEETKLIYFNAYYDELMNIALRLLKDIEYLKEHLTIFYLLFFSYEEPEEIVVAFEILIKQSYNNIIKTLELAEIHIKNINLELNSSLATKENKTELDVILLKCNEALNYCIEFKEDFEKLLVDPFKEGINVRILTYLSCCYADDFESIEEFLELASEKDLEFYELLKNKILEETPVYNFDSFELIVPECLSSESVV